MNALAWLLVPAAYTIGSIPVGLLMGLARGVDVRRHGSGNIGATNVARVLGRRAGLTCFALDALKGLIPTLGAGLALGTLGDWRPSVGDGLAWVAVAIATMMGHMFPVWLRFRGGKGIATGLGALLAVFPLLTFAALASLLVWVAFVAAWRMIGPASSVAALVLPLGVHASFLAARSSGWDAGTGPSPMRMPLLVITAALAALAIYKHRGNLARTIRGTEPRLGQRRPP